MLPAECFAGLFYSQVSRSEWREQGRFVEGGGMEGGIYVCATEKEREGQQEKGGAVYVWTCLHATVVRNGQWIEWPVIVARDGRKRQYQ